ncbi:MAG: phage portal protein [Mesorhizobium sp.]|uniref:phage portal protein n=1 Tax=Mesorhizobium sp. TaxID=1871066 RepID=UPI000FE93A29|nr:phage portal protein [Mesorhizobium sp.]RWD50560.1 MAG: phage portal protein [Mesorhizobium sp.]RWE55774.1 MAG: phage portal protein [Mesorhizobium sp.]RWF09679.1 MAG: phage portal protein [Mesorhizobium sp.]RWF20930.1 MAG: phage portal protein [Mesorhizobium sp.]TIY04325.1 MAG: phage portal protein [Mesorhizobium sp.]
MESIFGTPTTVAGPAINAATALRVPAVYSAIVLITGTIGSLPAKVFHSFSPSGKRAANDHPAYRLVHDEANDWTSAGALRATLTADALLHDHGYALANRVGDGKVQEFIRLDPRSVTIKADEITGEPVYEVRDGKNSLRRYGYRDILHISAPLGLAPIKAGRQAIGLAKVMEEYAAFLFANRARPGVVIKSPLKLGDDAKRKIRDSWNAGFRNDGNGGTAVFDEGMSSETVDAMTSADAEFTASRVEQVVEIARLFRVPPHLLFELSRATWSNAEEMFQAFLTLTLRPWLDAWEWAYARVLLTPEERASGYYVEFVVDDLLTANAETRAKVYAQYRAMGALTANEVRAGLNRAPIDGGDTLDNPNITPGKPAGQNDNRKPGEVAA